MPRLTEAFAATHQSGSALSRRPSLISLAIVSLFKAAPWIALVYAVIAYLRIGVDLPFSDDWRDYARSVQGESGFAFLFRPINGTLYPVGKLLDAIALNALSGNTVVYQALSMVFVLSALLLLQWRLLRAVAADELIAASSFALTLLSLQADSYWGLQYLAYHQALPLMCLLFICFLWVCLKWSSRTKMITTFIVGLVAGFSYVSGAIPALVGAATLVLLGRAWPQRRDFLEAGLALGAASLVTSVAQGYAILVIQGRNALHPDGPLATPFSLDFWIYALGKIGRSLALPQTLPTLSFFVSIAAAIGLVALAIAIGFILIYRRQLSEESQNGLAVTLFLSIVIGVYLCMVTAVRSNLRFPTVETSLDLFVFAFGRFHFFWLTILWPWLFLFCAQAITPGRFRRAFASGFAGVVALVLVVGGALDHQTVFRGSQSLKTTALECIRDQLLKADTIRCPKSVKGNLERHYANAVEVDASFVRSAPPTLRAYNQSPAFTVMEPQGFNAASTILYNVEDVRWNGGGVSFRSTGDANVIFRTGKPEKLAECLVLHVLGSIEGNSVESAQFYYQPGGTTGFSPYHQTTSAVIGGRATEFVVRSPSGFHDALRVDPVTNGDAVVSKMSVRCLVTRLPL